MVGGDVRLLVGEMVGHGVGVLIEGLVGGDVRGLVGGLSMLGVLVGGRVSCDVGELVVGDVGVLVGGLVGADVGGLVVGDVRLLVGEWCHGSRWVGS
jgi:hypothetical protein